ncbi:MAG: ISKra4 family transposase, partial [Acidimicrobiales bacterium]
MSAARSAATPPPSAGDGATSPDASAFGGPRACFEDIVGWLAATDEAGSLAHGELEDDLDLRGRDLLRRLLQDHLDLRARREVRVEVRGVDDVVYGSAEAGHTRALTTVFGTVEVERLAYRHRGAANLHPADGALNLPTERHSHGLRRLAAIESTRGSYDAAAEAISRATGVAVAKRQVEDLTRRAAADVEGFYATVEREPATDDDVLVLSVDGKGIVMRPDSLRPATEKAAAAATNKLETRLSKGEKRNRKRMAEVGA